MKNVLSLGLANAVPVCHVTFITNSLSPFKLSPSIKERLQNTESRLRFESSRSKLVLGRNANEKEAAGVKGMLHMFTKSWGTSKDHSDFKFISINGENQMDFSVVN